MGERIRRSKKAGGPLIDFRVPGSECWIYRQRNNTGFPFVSRSLPVEKWVTS